MTDVELERSFTVSPERLFRAISVNAELVQWWGLEDSEVTDGKLDFTATGPWFAVLTSQNGQVYKMSGQVTHVDAPNSIGLTWGWHDPDTDARGAESHVIFRVTASQVGATLRIEHSGLADSDIAKKHAQGWNSTMNALSKYLL